MHARRKEISGVLRVICRTEWVTVLYSGGEWGKPSNLQQYSLWTAARRPQSAQTSSEEDGNWTWTSTNTHTPIYTHTRARIPACSHPCTHMHGSFFLVVCHTNSFIFEDAHMIWSKKPHANTHSRTIQDGLLLVSRPSSEDVSGPTGKSKEPMAKGLWVEEA